MALFDEYDAALDDAQYETFGVEMLLMGEPVTAAASDEEVIFGEMQISSVVWSVRRKDIPAGFSRGAPAVIDGVAYQVSRIFPDDGANAQFELETV